MRARKPCFLMRRVLRGRYVGPMETPCEAGKRTRLRRDGARLTFPHAGRSFGPPFWTSHLCHSSMEQSTKETWKRLLDEARREHPHATVRTLLEPALPIALHDRPLI